jgi:hypothetical protein
MPEPRSPDSFELVPRDGPRRGHRHAWDRTLSRRSFLRVAAGTAGLVAGSRLWVPMIAEAAKGPGVPNPIPGCTQIDDLGCFHFFFPGHEQEPATITDFNGFVGIADITGTGVGTDPDTGQTIPLNFETDTRFMSGEFVAKDGRQHHGTFAFI